MYARKGGSKLILISVEESYNYPKKSAPVCVYIAIRPLLEFSPPVFNFVMDESRLLCVEHWGTVWREQCQGNGLGKCNQLACHLAEPAIK